MAVTPLMRQALERALKNDGLRRVFDDTPGKPRWPEPHQTLRALERHAYLTKSVTKSRKGYVMHVWRITDTGRKALTNATVLVEIPRSSHGYPRDPGDPLTGRRPAPEPEPVHYESRTRKRASRELRAAAIDPRERARYAKAA